MSKRSRQTRRSKIAHCSTDESLGSGRSLAYLFQVRSRPGQNPLLVRYTRSPPWFPCRT